jgi:hypothetical protein
MSWARTGDRQLKLEHYRLLFLRIPAFLAVLHLAELFQAGFCRRPKSDVDDSLGDWCVGIDPLRHSL